MFHVANPLFVETILVAGIYVTSYETTVGPEFPCSFFSPKQFLALSIRKVGASILKLRIGHEEFDAGFCEPGSFTRGFYYLEATSLFCGSNLSPNRPKGLSEFLGGFIHGTHFQYGLQYLQAPHANYKLAALVFNPYFGSDSESHDVVTS
jgi:hypothetical protein